MLSNAQINKLVEVQIAQKKSELLIKLSAPSSDMVGYEYYPKTLDEKIAFNRAMTILKNPRTFFAVNSEAGCRLSTKDVKHSLDDAKSLPSEKNKFSAEYSYNCSNPSKIKDIKYHWFTSFPSTKKISILASTTKGKKSGEVTAKSRRFYF